MTDIYYSHTFEPDSVAVKQVYYSQMDKLLFVETHREGVLAGYDEVPYEVFRDFSTADSAGQFWNYNVKNSFPGFNTHGVNLLPEWSGINRELQADELLDNNRAYVAEKRAEGTLSVEDVTKATEAPVQHRYEISAEVTHTVTRTIYSHDLDEALRLFQQKLLDDEEYSNVRVVSATRFFE